MRTLRHWLFLALLACMLQVHASAQTTGPGYVAIIEVHDTLQPLRARAFAREVAAAEHEGASAIVLDLSTPGGMESAADTMVAAMRGSTIPIIVWMGAVDSRVGGQGLRLVGEADATYMTKSTFLSPLWADRPRGLTTEQRDQGSRTLLAQLQAAAARHGRNPAALRELAWGSKWFTPEEAIQAGLVAGRAKKTEDVLQFADHLTFTRGSRTDQLELAGAQLHPMRAVSEGVLLLSLMNPNLDVLLLALGFMLIYLEINTPGIVVPGAAGLLLVLLSAFSLGTLPINSYAVALCVCALLLLVLEARLNTRGVLAATGVVALVCGLAMLVQGPISQLQVSWPTAIGAGVGFGGVTAALVVLGGRARRAKVKTGSEAMLGWLAVAQTPLAPSGRILVRGELWNARLTSNDTTVAAGERVKVLRADGLTLEVTAVPLTQSS